MNSKTFNQNYFIFPLHHDDYQELSLNWLHSLHISFEIMSILFLALLPYILLCFLKALSINWPFVDEDKFFVPFLSLCAVYYNHIQHIFISLVSNMIICHYLSCSLHYWMDDYIEIVLCKLRERNCNVSGILLHGKMWFR